MNIAGQAVSRIWVLLAAAGILVIAAFLGFQVFKPQIGERVFAGVVERTLVTGYSAEFDEGLTVFVCGAGSPMADPTRAGPCLAIATPDHALVFDTGSGAVRNLGRVGFPLARVDAAFLTHLHSDHIDSLGEFMLQAWINGSRTKPVPVYGPTGTAEVVRGFEGAYRIDSRYRQAHHGDAVANLDGFGGTASEIEIGGAPANVFEAEDPVTVYEASGLTVTAFRVDHAPVEPALGYRVDYRGRSVTISGDTVYSPTLVAAAQDTDLLIHDVLKVEMVEVLGDALERIGQDHLAQVMHDIPEYHATPVDAARAAQDANARMLLMSHVVPALPVRLLYAYYLEGTQQVYDGPVTIAEDGMIFHLPPGSTRIEQRRASGF